MVHLSVVIPVYKAEGCIPELYRRLSRSLKGITRNYEIILVEDCGGDRSWDLILRLARKDRKVKGLRMARNFGQHAAITAGLDHCRGDWVVVMDCDLQDRPEEIPRLYREAQKGHDMVVARRMSREDDYWKRTTSRVFYAFFRYLSGLHHDPRVGNFRIFSKRVAVQFRSMRESSRFFTGLMQWMGFPAASVDVQHAARYKGQTTYTYRKLFNLAIDAIIAYSDKPLWFTVRLGFLMTIAAFLGGLWIMLRALFQGIPVAGWASLIVSMYFLGGVVIGILGIVGIYVGKTYNETKRRPLYILRDSKNA